MTIIDPDENQRYEIFIKPDHIRGTLSLNSQELNLSLQSLMILPVNENQNIIEVVKYREESYTDSDYGEHGKKSSERGEYLSPRRSA